MGLAPSADAREVLAVPACVPGTKNAPNIKKDTVRIAKGRRCGLYCIPGCSIDRIMSLIDGKYKGMIHLRQVPTKAGRSAQPPRKSAPDKSRS